MVIPSSLDIENLHKKYAPSAEALNSVLTHSYIVRDIVRQLGVNLPQIYLELAEAGALLHDIGVYLLYKSNGEIDKPNYITHGTLGYDLLQRAGYVEELCRFAKFHTGVGITKAEILEKNLPLAPMDYFAESPEEKLVMYADKFHSKSLPPAFNSAEHYKELLQNFGQDKIAMFEDFINIFGNPDLEFLAKKYNQNIV